MGRTRRRLLYVGPGGSISSKLAISLLLIATLGAAQDARELADRVFLSTVSIRTDTGEASGFVIPPNVVATNWHVIETASFARVALVRGEKEYAVAGILARDEVRDLALLSVEIDALPISVSPEEPSVGDLLYAIGNPLGLTVTISDGILSGIRQKSGMVLY